MLRFEWLLLDGTVGFSAASAAEKQLLKLFDEMQSARK